MLLTPQVHRLADLRVLELRGLDHPEVFIQIVHSCHTCSQLNQLRWIRRCKGWEI